MPRKPGIPSLRRFKPRQLGVVTLNGHDHYLGRWPDDQRDPPDDVRAAYDRLIAEWLASGRNLNPAPVEKADAGVTVEELIGAFWAHAERHYRHPDGRPTGELSNVASALRPLRHLYGSLPAREFSPLKLKAVRELMVRGYVHPKYGEQQALSRKQINQRVGRIVRCFKWGVSEELVSAEVHQALRTVAGLAKGRTEAKESPPVEPADPAHVEAALAKMPAQVAGLVRLQRLTGMRPSEACVLRLCDLDRSGPVWLYRPASHKTQWKGKGRVVAIGPKAQQVLCEFIRIRCPLCEVEGRPPRIGSRDGVLCGPCADRMEEQGAVGPWPRIETHDHEAHLFSPVDAVREREEDLRSRRKTPVQPSQVCRKKTRPERSPRPCYDANSYGQAVRRACAAAGVSEWAPNQLRHLHATEVRRRFGLEAAQVCLGHASADVTQVYAEADLTLAAKVAREMG